MAEKIFKGFRQVEEGTFSAENGYLYFIRKSSNTGKTDGYLQFNGRKYGTAAEAAEELKGKIGTIPEGYSDLVSYINAKVSGGINELNADVSGSSNGVEVGVVQESGVVTTVKVTAPNFSEIYAPISVTSAETRLAAIEADYLKSDDKTELNNAITAETAAREAALTAETAAREAAVKAVADNLTAETAAREAAVKTVADNLTAETAAREAAVKTVADNLTAETEARESADSALSGRLDSLEAISGQSHTHTNKDVLDGITKDKVDAWDAIAGGAAVTLNPDAAVTDGYLKTYEIFQGGNSIGKIDIPKDLVVTKGEVIEKEGAKYLRLTIANQEAPVDIAVADLAHVYTQGNGIEISSGDVVSAKVVAANGLSLGANGIAMGLADGSNNGAMSSADFTKLGTIEASAQTNVIETVKVDGVPLVVTDKAVDVALADKYAPKSLTGTVETNRSDFDKYTGATDGRLNNIETSAKTWNNVAGSADTRISALETVSAGTRLDAIEALSAGTRLGTLEAVSAGTRLDALEALTSTTSSALQSISAANDSVTVSEKDDSKNQSVAVKISTEFNNALKLVEGQGLFAAIYYDGNDSD